MNEDTKKKLDRIQELLKQKESIERELEKLLSPEKVVALPSDFSMNNVVFDLFKSESERNFSSKEILRILQNKYPTYGINRKQVGSALAYLKNSKRTIDSTDRGLYHLVKTEERDVEPPKKLLLEE